MSMAGGGWSSVAITDAWRAEFYASLLRHQGYNVKVVPEVGTTHVQTETRFVDQACEILFGGALT